MEPSAHGFGHRYLWGEPYGRGRPFGDKLVLQKGHAMPSEGLCEPSKDSAERAKGMHIWTMKEGPRHLGNA